MTNINQTEDYFNLGYHLERELFSQSFCEELKNYINTNVEPKAFIPFSDIPWGYGNLYNVGPFSKISENKKILDFCKKIIGTEITFNHLIVNDKPAWVGPDFEWHQEMFNVNTYAPGYSEKDWKSFAQIFIPLDNQNSLNGGLKIIPQSHKEGILPYEDFVNSNLSHKRRVKVDMLNQLSKKYGVIDFDLKAGDVLFFNHLLIHASSKNLTNKSRKSLVLQARSNIKNKNQEIFDKETSFRSNFIIKFLKEKVDQLNKTNIYDDFNKK